MLKTERQTEETERYRRGRHSEIQTYRETERDTDTQRESVEEDKQRDTNREYGTERKRETKIERENGKREKKERKKKKERQIAFCIHFNPFKQFTTHFYHFNERGFDKICQNQFYSYFNDPELFQQLKRKSVKINQ